MNDYLLLPSLPPALGLAGRSVRSGGQWLVIGGHQPDHLGAGSHQPSTLSHQQAIGYDNAKGHGGCIEETLGSSTVQCSVQGP